MQILWGRAEEYESAWYVFWCLGKDFWWNMDAQTEEKSIKIYSLTFRMRVSSDLSKDDKIKTWQDISKQDMWISCLKKIINKGTCKQKILNDQLKWQNEYGALVWKGLTHSLTHSSVSAMPNCIERFPF